VEKYLKEHGYTVIPVNPAEKEIIGEKAYPDLSAIPGKVDVVDVFRRPEDIPPIAREAARIGAKVLWLQEGIISQEAECIAGEAGMEFVMDTCIRKQHIRHFG
jgi:predicted CoA-binding protein